MSAAFLFPIIFAESLLHFTYLYIDSMCAQGNSN